MKKILKLIGIICMLVMLPLGAHENKTDIYSKATGYWACGCSDDVIYLGYIDIINKDKVVINIADNQIYVISKLKIENKNEFSLYYVSSDIGRGGSDIAWDDVSKSSSIGTIKLIDDKLEFTWKGLNNKVNKEQIDIPIYSFPFSEKNKTIMLEKCEDNI